MYVHWKEETKLAGRNYTFTFEVLSDGLTGRLQKIVGKLPDILSNRREMAPNGVLLRRKVQGDHLTSLGTTNIPRDFPMMV